MSQLWSCPGPSAPSLPSVTAPAAFWCFDQPGGPFQHWSEFQPLVAVFSPTTPHPEWAYTSHRTPLSLFLFWCLEHRYPRSHPGEWLFAWSQPQPRQEGRTPVDPWSSTGHRAVSWCLSAKSNIARLHRVFLHENCYKMCDKFSIYPIIMMSGRWIIRTGIYTSVKQTLGEWQVPPGEQKEWTFLYRDGSVFANKVHVDSKGSSLAQLHDTENAKTF